MPGFWQPSLWYKSPRSKSVSMFSSGKRGDQMRHVKYHRIGLRRTTNKFTFGGTLFDMKKAVAKRQIKKRQKSLF